MKVPTSVQVVQVHWTTPLRYTFRCAICCSETELAGSWAEIEPRIATWVDDHPCEKATPAGQLF